MPAAPPLVVAIVGAARTGKTTLARALAPRLAALTGLTATVVEAPAGLGEQRRGGGPKREELAAIARDQQQRIDAAAARHALVVADTTPLQTAVEALLHFGDAAWVAPAAAAQRGLAATLLAATDLPWAADASDGGPALQRAADATLRGVLLDHGLAWSVVGGLGESRLAQAVDALAPTLRRRTTPGSGLFRRLAERDAAQPAWRWICDACDVPECEHALRAAARRR
jgi:nicotinamide riboside kinase